MKVTLPHPRVLLCALASLVLVRPAMAESDHRRVQFAKPYTLVLQAATGSIDVMNPFASQALATLYKDGDSFAFEPGKDYVLKLNESPEGVFSFEWNLKPVGEGPAWSCTVKAIPTEPFIKVQVEPLPGTHGVALVNTDRTKRLIEIQ